MVREMFPTGACNYDKQLVIERALLSLTRAAHCSEITRLIIATLEGEQDSFPSRGGREGSFSTAPLASVSTEEPRQFVMEALFFRNYGNIMFGRWRKRDIFEHNFLYTPQ